MVRQRVGDWKLSWRFALAGLLGSVLVIALASTGIAAGPFAGGQGCAAAPAFHVLIGWPTYEACKDYIAVDEMPGLQLKGKSAETFRILKVTAIREGAGSPWVPIPTDAASEAFAAKRKLYTTQEVFA